MVNLAITKIGGKNWTGGDTYLINLIGMIKKKLSNNIKIHLILSVNKKNNLKDSFLKNVKIIEFNDIEKINSRFNRIKTFLFGKNKQFEKLLIKNSINLIFETGYFLGRNFKIPIISWIPDFQHKHLSNYFSKYELFMRERDFKLKIYSKRSILLSSKSAYKDLQTFYKITNKNIGICNFTIDIDLENIKKNNYKVLSKYKIIDKFIYIPNQFWKHKNHLIIFNMFIKLYHSNKLLYNNIPHIYLSGLPKDDRNKDHVETYLGLINLDDVYSLNMLSYFLINPSFFEGWSTTVEEAKSFGTKLLLSDISVHREQSPNATFFNPNSIESLIKAVEQMINKLKSQKKKINDLTSYNSNRLNNYSNSFMELVNKTIN